MRFPVSGWSVPGVYPFSSGVFANESTLTRSPPPPPPPLFPGLGFLDRTALAAACVASGLPGGDDFVSEVAATFGAGARDLDDVVVDYATFARTIRRRDASIRAAWTAVCRAAGDDRTVDASARRLTADDALTAARAVGAANATRDDARAMVALLGECESDDGNVGLEEFRRLAVLLPPAHIAGENATWNWLVAAAPVGRERDRRRARVAARLVAGGVAGVAARTAVAPLDRARTIAQDAMRDAAFPGSRSSRSVGSVCRRVLREEGVLGLWRGNAVTALKVFPANALQFAIFHHAKDAFRRLRTLRGRADGERADGETTGVRTGETTTGVRTGDTTGVRSGETTNLTVAERLAAGSLAGAVSTAACYPLDTLKSQMAVRGGLRGSALAAAAQMFREQGGARAFYKGLGPTLVADIIGTGLGFTLYDSFVGWYRRVVGGRKPTPAEKGALGGASACVCLTVTQPLEVVMTRMRVQGVGGRPVLYKNAVDCLRVIARREGMRSLWLGLGAAYGKIFPQLAITYCVFEMVNERMGVDGLARYDGGNTHGKGGEVGGATASP